MKNNDLEDYLANRDYVLISMNRSVVGHFEVETEINSKRVLMLLDTGASKTVLHDPVAQSLGISTKDSVNCGGGLGTSEAKVGTGFIREFKIGSLHIEQFPIHIMDFSHPISSIEARGGNKICGVIGADILAPGSAIIDYGGANLYLKTSIFQKAWTD